MKNGKGMSKGAKIRLVVIILLVILIAALGIVIIKMKFSNGDEPNSFSNTSGMNFGEADLSEFVAAYGVTSIGMVEEAFPIDELSAALEVEEVLISSGAEVTAETAILKFSDESVAEVREELESTLRAANLAYRAGKIEYEQAVINAKYEYETTVLAGQQAEAVYNETVANLEESVDRAREEYEDAKEQIAEYEDALANDTYKANLEACQNEYDENYQLLVKYMEEWGIEWSEITGMGGGMQGDSTHAQYVSVLKDLYSVLESNMKDLTAAEQEYDDAVNNASFNLQTLQLSLPELDEAYANAQANYETSLIQAKLTKETTLTEAELAQKNYETNLEKAESDLETLEEAKETAEENLEIFEKQMGTGYYYPTETGTVLRVSARAGREITSGSTLFMLQNSEEMTVTVSVDQADIAKLNVGDSAIVVSEDAGNYQGVITSINPVSQSDSRSSITYSVTVTLSGRTTGLSTNETVSVYFTAGGSNEEK